MDDWTNRGTNRAQKNVFFLSRLSPDAETCRPSCSSFTINLWRGASLETLADPLLAPCFFFSLIFMGFLWLSFFLLLFPHWLLGVCLGTGGSFSVWFIIPDTSKIILVLSGDLFRRSLPVNFIIFSKIALARGLKAFKCVENECFYAINLNFTWCVNEQNQQEWKGKVFVCFWAYCKIWLQVVLQFLWWNDATEMLRRLFTRIF